MNVQLKIRMIFIQANSTLQHLKINKSASRNDIGVVNKKIPVINLYINDKCEINNDIIVQVITDYFGDGIDSNGYSAENITVSLNGDEITLTANDVTFDNEAQQRTTLINAKKYVVLLTWITVNTSVNA